jgi:predicted esterase
MKALKLLLIGIAFLILFYWYTNSVKNSYDVKFNTNIVKKVLTFDKDSRNCYISGSANRLKDKNVPLLVFLHGMDGAWPNRKFTKPQYNFINKLVWDKNMIAVFPQGTQGACHDPKVDIKNEFLFYNCWNTKNDKDRIFIKKLIEAMTTQYKINPKKVYLIGFSNGAYFVSDYFLFHNDNLFSGYGIHSGGAINFEKSVIDFSKLKISLNVGNKDKFQLNEMRELKEKLLNKGMLENNNLKYNEYIGTHEMSKKALESELEFFLKE